MDFMKVFDQTVREIKREVNLKVLKVPEIEQKVLDATDNEPWGPHGTALAEIAQATKKIVKNYLFFFGYVDLFLFVFFFCFHILRNTLILVLLNYYFFYTSTECQMVMNVLWTRLGETGKDWRYVYKALAVIEYLVGNGSERAVDDIIEHTFQISALSSFEYVEPSGKDVGLNVRKKAENIVSLLNDRDKIHDVRNKAAANRDKYIGVSSSGITYKSGGSASYSSGGISQSSGKYGGFGSRDGDRFSDSNRDKGGSYDEDYHGKSHHTVASDNQDNSFKKGSSRSVSKSPENKSSRVSKSSTNANNYGSVPSQSSSVPENSTEDDMDDFDPRGTSTKSSAGNSNQVDLFGQDLIGDFMDAPTSVPVEKPTTGNLPEVDLFADASFVSATPQMDKGASSQPQAEVDLFASQPPISTVTPTVDLFSIPEPVVQPDSKPEKSGPVDNSSFDPFAAVPLNNFDGSDIFGDFTSQSDSLSSQPSNNVVSDDKHDNIAGKSLADSKVPAKKDTFQVKSGVWADSLSRGLIDLNITAPKKVSLADVGIVGDLSDGFDGKEKGPPPSFYMGRAMGSGSGSLGIGRSGFTPSQPAPGDDIFSNLGSQQYQFGGFQK